MNALDPQEQKEESKPTNETTPAPDAPTPSHWPYDLHYPMTEHPSPVSQDQTRWR